MQDLNMSRNLITHITFNCSGSGFLLHDNFNWGKGEEGKRGGVGNKLVCFSHAAIYYYIYPITCYTPVMDNTVNLTGSRISRVKPVHTKRVT